MATTASLPTAAEKVTAKWLSSVLPQEVASIEVTKTILDATTGKLFVTLTWANPAAAEAASLPYHLCIKGGFNPAMIGQSLSKGLITVYTHEAMFFKHVAPTIVPPHGTIEFPRCWWSGADAGNAICIFDDLTKQGCTFGEGAATYSVAWVRELLEQLAGLHAATLTTVYQIKRNGSRNVAD
jgi:hypothetical protein